MYQSTYSGRRKPENLAVQGIGGGWQYGLVAFFLGMVADGKFMLIRNIMSAEIAGATGDLGGGSAVVVHLHAGHISTSLLRIIKKIADILHKQGKSI